MCPADTFKQVSKENRKMYTEKTQGDFCDFVRLCHKCIATT